MKRIVIVSNTSWNIVNFRLNLARTLKTQGHEVIVAAPYDKHSKTIQEEFEYFDIYISNKGTNPIEDLKTLSSFYKLYKELSPDVVLHYTIKPNIYGALAASFLNINVINNISGLGTVFIKENIVTRIVKYLYRVSHKNVNKVFFQNIDDYNKFLDERLVQKDRSEILPGSGVDIEKFQPSSMKEDKSNKFIFLVIARMLWDKGIKEYIEAAKIVKKEFDNVTFQLLGSVDSINKTAIPKDQIKLWEQEGIVDYLGETNDVRKYIGSADCIVLPSYREGTPRTLLEAASMAKPLITTDVPGCRNVVNDKVNGFLCEVKKPEDLASKMLEMLNLTEEERVHMGQNGRSKIIKEFDEKIVINKYLYSINDL